MSSADAPFSIQSISKVFSLDLALKTHGEQARFDGFLKHFHEERPHQAVRKMKVPADLYKKSTDPPMGWANLLIHFITTEGNYFGGRGTRLDQRNVFFLESQ
jgi:hypothetical protein